jgi:hypothetical protein
MFVISSIFACILTHYRRLIYKERSPVIELSKILLLYEFDPNNLPIEHVRLTVPASSPGCP